LLCQGRCFFFCVCLGYVVKKGNCFSLWRVFNSSLSVGLLVVGCCCRGGCGVWFMFVCGLGVCFRLLGSRWW